MTKIIRLTSLLLVIAVCFVMLFSAAYIITEADHDCSGEHCPTCYQLSVCIDSARKLCLAAFAVAVAAATIYTAVILICCATERYDGVTLVSLKVKLSN